MNTQQPPFKIVRPNQPKVPIVISVPHCGTAFPIEIIQNYKPELIQQPDDTDWFVHQLYSFASDLGITIIHAHYSRWVIDLNRDPESLPLYNDGRIITALCPSTDFLGNNLYQSKGDIPSKEEIERRLDKYYWPYYNAIKSELDELKNQFGQVLLWDAHSIRQKVPTIRKEAFPDLILGNNNEQSAAQNLIDIALNGLKNSSYQVNHNHPFKGGHITRYFGRPEKNIHALQLEMTKLLYMDDSEMKYDNPRAQKVVSVLEPIFIALIKALQS